MTNRLRLALLASRLPVGNAGHVGASGPGRKGGGRTARAARVSPTSRVRDHGTVARVELPPAQWPRAIELRVDWVRMLLAAPATNMPHWIWPDCMADKVHKVRLHHLQGDHR